MSEYCYSNGIKITIWICALLLATVFIALPIRLYLDENYPLSYLYFVLPISLSFVGLSIAGIWDVMITKVVITDRFIHSNSIFGNRKLRVEEIKYHERGRNFITIYPKNKYQPKIKVSPLLSYSYRIINWLEKVSTDLDVKTNEDELKEFYNNREFGFTEEERGKKLNIAKRTAKAINISSIVIVMALLFLKLPEIIVIPIIVFIPVIVIGTVIFFKGIIKFRNKEEEDNTIYPSVFWGFAAPIFGLTLKALFTIHIFNSDALWTPLFILTVVVFFLCIYGAKEYKLNRPKEYMVVIGMFIICLAYSFGSIMFFNKLLDKTSPRKEKVLVLGKKITKGKTTSYNFEFQLKKISNKIDQYTVAKSLYDHKDIGDTVTFYLYKGKLGIPYYKIK